MKYWLMKSEAETFSWDDLVKKGSTDWDGVRNHQAANNMKAMQLGDRCFFYHSGDEKRIVGIMEVSGLYRPDPSDEKGRFGMVAVKPLGPVPKPVTLSEIKADPKLAHLLLVRHTRLSVVPIDAPSWRRICKMAGAEA
ncbi:MAG TPA: EVE domain-containing protein [Candidatus Cybelea sp.]|nr:EVE domain-containing protein [Candidatus Cybelea sp.]